MILRSRIYNNEHFWVSLTIDAIHILTKYVYLFINMIEIEAMIKAWIVKNQIYDLLLEISWMKKINFNSNYKMRQIIICENNNVFRAISIKIFSYETNLSTIKFKENEEIEENVVDTICQILLDEQKNFNFWWSN